MVGGPCQGCEAVFEYGDEELLSVDTLPLFDSTQPKMKITGTVFQVDGLTPANNVVVYIYHTNREGIYQKMGNEKGWGRTHGFIRGWVKTDNSGRYTFYTFRPGAYPSRSEPEHIHITLCEPNGKYYYIHNSLFADDPLLETYEQKRPIRGGGFNVITLTEQQGLLICERDIILGRNIPDY